MTLDRTLPATGGEDAAVSAGSAPREQERVEKVGRYLLLGQLGAGAMGIVHAAYDPELDRKVAVKLLLPRAGGPEDAGRARLLREAQALAQLSHPNVVAVYDVGVHGDSVWMAMELVAGQTLGAWAGERPRRSQELLRVLVDVARGVAAAHAGGLVHRDLKPDNVMVGSDGRVRVMDFGLAHGRTAEMSAPRLAATLEDDSEPLPLASTLVSDARARPELAALALRLTQAGAIQGTPAYMAPEQWEGRDAGVAADQFGWSVMAWELLYGEPPFAGATMIALATAVLSGQRRPPPPGRKLPKWVRRVLERGLDTDPSRRFPTMEALLAAVERGQRQSQQWAAAALIAGLAVLVAAVAAIVTTRVGDTASTWQPEIHEMPAREEAGLGLALSPDGTRLAFTSDRERQGHPRIYVSNRDGADERAISPKDLAFYEVAWAPDGKSLYSVATPAFDGYRLFLDGTPPERLASGVRAAVPCGDGVLLVHMGAGDCPHCERIVIRDPGGRERELHTSPHALRGPVCDRTGDKILFVEIPRRHIGIKSRGELWLIVAGEPPRPLTHEDGLNAYGTFTAAGDSVVYSSIRGGRQNLWELALDGTTSAQLTFGDGPDILPQVSADGSALAFIRDESTVPVFAVETDGQVRRVTSFREDVMTLDLAPDGRTAVASVLRDGRRLVVQIDVDDGSEQVLFGGWNPAYTPDGTGIVYVETGNDTRIVAAPRDGGPARLLGEAPAPVDRLKVGVDGFVHFSSTTASEQQAWRIPITGGAPEPEPDAQGHYFVWPAPAGGWRMYAALTETGSILTLTAPGMTPDDPAATVIRRARRAAWAPDGQAVYAFQDGHLRRISRTGEVERDLGPRSWIISLTAAPDGTVYTTDTAGRSRRSIITNFATRPPLR